MTTRAWRVWLVGLVLVCGGGAAAQQVSMDPARQIIGRVVDATTNQPLPGVLVELTGVALNGDPLPTLGTRRQFTTAQARFAFTQLPAGRYTLRARVAGNMPAPNGFIQNSSGFPIGAYLDGGYAQQRPGGSVRPIVLSGADASFDAHVRMWKSAVIAGVVADDLGEPLVDVIVGAARVSSDGRLTNGPTARTDDLGRYRLSALEPGRYVVFVPQMQVVTPMTLVEPAMARFAELQGKGLAGATQTPDLIGVRVGDALVSTSSSGYIDARQPPHIDGDKTFVMPTTFLPASTLFNLNGAIEVKAGEERSSADVTVKAVPTAAVSGTVLSGGTPASSLYIYLLPTGSSDASMFAVARGLTDTQGRFVFPAVPYGSYTVYTQAAASAATPNPGAWINEPIAVDEHGATALTLSLRGAFTVRGRLEFEGASARPTEAALKNLKITVNKSRLQLRIPEAPPIGEFEGSAQFVARGVAPGRYIIRPTSTRIGDWWLRSIEVGGRDGADAPIDITEDLTGVVVTFTDKPASLAIKASGADADDPIAVVVFPSDRATWGDARQMTARVRSATLPASGDATLTNVLPGDYLAVGVPESLLADFPDVALLNKLAPLANAVRVIPGERASVTLTMKRVQ